MKEKGKPIPSRIFSAASDGIVTGANSIKDDRLGRNQEDINKDTYRKNEVYNKDEINNIISRTPETDVVVLDVPEGSIAADVLDEVPLADRPNKLFRLRNDDNTHYDEYGWTGEEWALLASKDYGIDDEPLAGSDNLIKSKAVADIVNKEKEDDNMAFSIIDKNGNILLYITKDKKIKSFLESGLESDYFKILDAEQPNETFCLVDSYNNILAEGKNGKFYIYGKVIDFDNTKTVSPSGDGDSVYELYKNKEGLLWSVSNYKVSPDSNGKPSKRAQLMITTDTHSELTGFSNAFALAKDFRSFSAVLCLGDLCDTVLDDYDASKNIWNSASGIPKYVVLGNHDVGSYSKAIQLCKSTKQIYNDFIYPSSVGISEREHQENKCYWYHDFTDCSTRLRLIGLDAFDDGCPIDDSVWAPIEYDATLSDIQAGIYQAGDKVNVPGYTEYSFEAVNVTTVQSLVSKPKSLWNRIAYSSSYADMEIGQTYNNGDRRNVPNYMEASFEVISSSPVTISSEADYPTNETDNVTHPRYKTCRANRWYSQEQLEWLIDLLVDAAKKNDEDAALPSSERRGNYVVALAQHYPAFSGSYCVADTDKAFHNELRYRNIYDEHGEVSYVTSIGSNASTRYPSGYIDIIAMIVDAYTNKGTVDFDIVPQNGWRVIANYPQYTDVCYDDCSDIEPIHLHHDFSEDGYNTPSVVTFLSGHNHSDAVLRHKEYENTIGLIFISGRTDNDNTRDITRGLKGETGYDAVTSYTVFDDGVHLCRIGNDAARKNSGNRIAFKNNEFIEF